MRCTAASITRVCSRSRSIDLQARPHLVASQLVASSAVRRGVAVPGLRRAAHRHRPVTVDRLSPDPETPPAAASGSVRSDSRGSLATIAGPGVASAQQSHHDLAGAPDSAAARNATPESRGGNELQRGRRSGQAVTRAAIKYARSQDATKLESLVAVAGRPWTTRVGNYRTMRAFRRGKTRSHDETTFDRNPRDWDKSPNFGVLSPGVDAAGCLAVPWPATWKTAFGLKNRKHKDSQ